MRMQKPGYSILLLWVASSALAEKDEQEVVEHKEPIGSPVITRGNFDKDEVENALIYNKEGEVVGVSIEKLKETGTTIRVEQQGKRARIMPKGLNMYDVGNGVAIDPHGNTFELDLKSNERADGELLSELGQFAVKTHLHGFNYEDIKKFEGSEVTELVGLLNDSRWKTKWFQIAVLIGMLGERDDAEVLKKVIKRYQYMNDRFTRRALQGAYEGLGYLAANTHSDAALTFLLASYNHRHGHSDGARTAHDEKMIDFSIARGLAISANQKSIDALVERKKATRDEGEKQFLEAQILRANQTRAKRNPSN